MIEYLSNTVKALLANSDGSDIDEENPLNVAAQFGVPNSFTKQTSSSVTKLIQKGQLNHYRQRPAIINEHVESAREEQSIITSTNEVGQIFRASQDNINSITLTLESAQGQSFDDFESYADNAALQAAWIETDPGDPAELEQIIVPPNGGTQSMRLPGDASLDDEWYREFPSTNFTGYIGEFDFYNSRAYSDVKFRVYVHDTLGNTSSGAIINQDQDAWEHIEIDVDLLTADGATAADLTQITRIGFRIVDRRNGSDVYIDNMISVPPPGQVNVELWDMGTGQPVSGVTSLDDGTQYEELGDRGINSGTIHSSIMLDLVGGKRQYTMKDFVAGVALEIPSNTTLNVGNYYALVLRYADTDVSVYGPNTSFNYNYYTSGYAFTTPDNSTAITAIGEYSDIQFAIFSTQDVYINTLVKAYDAQPGNNATEIVNIEDSNMNIIGIIASETQATQFVEAEFKDRVFYLPKGGKLEVNHNDDFTDPTSQINILIGYIYNPESVALYG